MIYFWTFLYIGASIFISLCLSLSGKKEKKRQIHYIDHSNKTFKKNKWHLLILISCIFLFVAMIIYHHYSIASIIYWTVPFVIIAFSWNLFFTISSYFNPTYLLPDGKNLDEFRTAVIIPVYNEDKEIFKKSLKSLTEQSHLPDYVMIIEDGSLEENKCQEIFEDWKKSFPNQSKYIYKSNAGKREAQAVAFHILKGKVDIFITIDSDTILDNNAIKEGLLPFFNQKVMSVGGVLLDYNNQDNFLTRTVGVSFVSAFSNGRSAYSTWKAVGVNHGCLAFYRSEVIENNLEHYLSQIVFSQKAKFGDDRMLTQYASIMGDTVYQETSIGYTLNPVKLSHLLRQRSRWWRSFWWGGIWFLKNQSPKKMAWWIQVSHYISFGAYTPIFIAVYLYYPILNSCFPFEALIYMIVLGYIRNLRVLVFQRNDMTKWQQFMSFVIFSPFSTLLNFLICTFLQIYGLLTVWKVGNWGTRKNVEVGID